MSHAAKRAISDINNHMARHALLCVLVLSVSQCAEATSNWAYPAHHVHHMSLSSGNAQSVSLAVSFVRLFPPVQRIDKEGRDAPDVKFRRAADSTLPLHLPIPFRYGGCWGRWRVTRRSG